MALAVRERPPLRLNIDVTAPNGVHRRWARDERRPENVPANISLQSEMPGGHSSFSCTLPRDPSFAYEDTQRLSNVRVMGAGGQVAWEGRLEATPRVSGSQMAISPQAVGWQMHLDDDPSAAMIYVDQDLTHWGDASTQRRIDNGSSVPTSGPSVVSDETTGAPALSTALTDTWAAPNIPRVEAWYSAHGIDLGSIYYAWKINGVGTAAPWTWLVALPSTDTNLSADATASLVGAGPGTGTLSATVTGRKFALVFLNYAATPAGTAGGKYEVLWTRLAVYGNHGLPKRGTASATAAQGFYASDVIAHAIRTWAPLLTYTTGASGSITDSTFVIPQLEFRDPTTAGQIISAANRYHLRDWAVWENPSPGGKPMFYFHERGARGKSWRARVAPAQLEEAGPSMDNLYNGVIVVYQDVDGTTKRVGPTGSGADTISTSVMDTDPLNPANQLGIRRWAILDMGGVSTAAGATEVGRRFLVESAQYNTAGRAQLVGHVEDDRGVVYPAWRVRAGDTVSFVDASYTDPRRVVRATYDDNSKTCSVDLDAPAEGLDALLQRLQVVLVGVI